MLVWKLAIRTDYKDNYQVIYIWNNVLYQKDKEYNNQIDEPERTDEMDKQKTSSRNKKCNCQIIS